MSRRGSGPVTVLNVAEKLSVAKSCREVENTAFEVVDVCRDVDVCRAVKHNLYIRRAHFSALIDMEIHEAVQNLRESNKLFAQAVDAREEIDLRIGASFTRFQTMLLRDRFSIDSTGDKEKSRVISYGPCQFPTLGFIVERYCEFQAHEPEEFWTINCSHESEDGLAIKAENKYVMFYNLFIGFFGLIC
ncbi:unnamed protein product [Brassica oleracea]